MTQEGSRLSEEFQFTEIKWINKHNRRLFLLFFYKVKNEWGFDSYSLLCCQGVSFSTIKLRLIKVSALSSIRYQVPPLDVAVVPSTSHTNKTRNSETNIYFCSH